MWVCLILSLTLILMSTASGEDTLRRQKRYVAPKSDVCSFYNALVKFINEYNRITLEEISSQVINLKQALDKYKTQTGISYYVKSLRQLARSVQSVVNGLNSMRKNRPDVVEHIRAINFNKKVENAGKALMAKSLPFYTHTQDMLTWQQAIGFKIKKNTKGAAKKLVTLVKKSLKKTRDPLKKGPLSSLSKTANIFYKNVIAAANAFTKTLNAFIATKKMIDNQRKKRDTHPLPEFEFDIATMCFRTASDFVPDYSEGFPFCPGCGDGGRCVRYPRVAFCVCAPMWQGELCDKKRSELSLPVCVASGDTHIRTFDQKTAHIQVDCQLIMSQPSSSRGIGFQYKLDQYFKNPGVDKVTWIKSVYLKLYGMRASDGTQDQNEFEILHSDARGYRVEINGHRVDSFDYSFKSKYMMGPNTPVEVDHIIKIVDGYVTINVLDSFAVMLKFTGNANPGIARFYFDPNYWQSIEGLCGDADGHPEDDMRERWDPDHQPIKGTNPGRIMGNSWLDEYCIDNGIRVTLADLPTWTIVNRRRKRRSTTDLDPEKIEMAKQLCKYADCQLTEGTPRFDGCVADVYYSATDKEICNVLEAEIFTHSQCWQTEFDCGAIKNEAKRRK